MAHAGDQLIYPKTSQIRAPRLVTACGTIVLAAKEDHSAARVDLPLASSADAHPSGAQ